MNATLKADGPTMTIWFWLTAASLSAVLCAGVAGCLAYVTISLHRGAPLLASRRKTQPLAAFLIPAQRTPPSRRFRMRTSLALSRMHPGLQPAYVRVR